jgi:hypothetical protein
LFKKNNKFKTFNNTKYEQQNNIWEGEKQAKFFSKVVKIPIESNENMILDKWSVKNHYLDKKQVVNVLK